MKQVIIQYGGTGDLSRKKLIPAYHQLLYKGFDLTILFLGRRYDSRDEFIENMIPKKIREEDFLEAMEYIRYDMKEESDNLKVLQVLQKKLSDTGEIELIYYLALHPDLYEGAVEGIKKINTYLGDGVRKKVVVEKPFGFDFDTAVNYNEVLKHAFTDQEIFRVDHYLGKEFIQNLLVLRFKNDIIHGIWNKDFIDHIQIVIDEDSGIETRLDYYEKTGVIRDMVQNHVLQILSNLAIGEPIELNQKEIAYEKVKIMRAVRPLEDFIVGRYSGIEGEGKTPTFFACTFYVDTFEFAGIPFFVRTGKKMPSSQSFIYIQFKEFRAPEKRTDHTPPNSLIIEIQPNMKIDLMLNVKKPGKFSEVDGVKLNFDHFQTFRINTPEAYEQIVQKILEGDKILFPSEEEIKHSWELVDPLIERSAEKDLETYEPGNVPESAIKLIEKHGRCWYGLCG
jgi:glucose-6-phosphate 1-dehydrogenase